MRFLLCVIDTETGTATSTEMHAIDEFNDRLQAGGHWVMAAGVGAPSTATVIDGRGAEPVVTPGPVVDNAEYMSGFWIIDAPDHETALSLAAQGSRACNRRVELRPFLGG